MYKSACMFTSDRCRSRDWRFYASCLHVLCHTEPLERVCWGRCEEPDRWFLSSCPSLLSKKTSVSQAEMLPLSSHQYIVHYFLHGCQSNEIEKIWGNTIEKWRPDTSTNVTEHALRRSIELRKVCFCSVGHRYSCLSFLYIFIYMTFDYTFLFAGYTNKLVQVCIGT